MGIVYSHMIRWIAPVVPQMHGNVITINYALACLLSKDRIVVQTTAIILTEMWQEAAASFIPPSQAVCPIMPHRRQYYLTGGSTAPIMP
jgi:hypothetical protein